MFLVRVVCAAGLLAVPATLLTTEGSAAAPPVCTIVGSPGADDLVGTPGPDVLCGLGGDDVLQGLAGNDVLRGGDGDDVLYPGPGSNEAWGEVGSDTVRYDDLDSGSVEVRLSARSVTGAVTDLVVSIENAVGTERDDRLVGTAGDNRFEGLGGRDFLVGRDGADDLLGGSGPDAIRPGRGDDTADGGLDKDTLSYRFLTAGVVVDLAAGTTGGDAGSDDVAGFENIVGTPADDVLRGTVDVPNIINALAGDDVIFPGGPTEADVIRGDAGIDTLDYSSLGRSIIVNLTSGRAGILGKVTGVEDIVGTIFEDQFYGDAGPNRIWGGGGTDFLDGRGGDDTIDAGEGNDWVMLGQGSDVADGGTGIDTARYLAADSGIWLDLDAGTVTRGSGEADQITHFQQIIGSRYDDHMYGGLGATEVALDGGAGVNDLNTVDGFAGDRMRVSSGSPGLSTCVGDPGDVSSC
ncbi:calcium-binding protein [Nocardioides pelophilus]|uniref:calcium-binding protein n=1 Tax=Nocardioides pelophilus TaxID=2172019 RepID=UPI0016036A0B|nr:calcium-binding protein [Nocardioides pelophilus]